MKNNSSDLTDKIIENIKTKKEELEQLYEKKVNGHILRSKAMHIEGNEKNTKYFANLEKRKAEKKTIHE